MRTTVVGLRATAIALVLATVSACAGIPSGMSAQVPTAGPIKQGEQVGVEPEDQFIRVIAREPRPGMSSSEVVQGFLDASASFDGGHAVARQYLTAEASADWETNSGVTVYDGVPALSELGSAVVMAVREAGTIAENGRYEVKGPAAEFRTTFDLTKVDGEWRIEDLPQGLLLSQSDVDRAFRSFSVYFFNPAFETLVPDPRMVPVIGPGLATTLVRRLVAGPSDWLQPAVRTGFPAGVRLNIDSVPIEAGVARVDLTANAREADDQHQAGPVAADRVDAAAAARRAGRGHHAGRPAAASCPEPRRRSHATRGRPSTPTGCRPAPPGTRLDPRERSDSSRAGSGRSRAGPAPVTSRSSTSRSRTTRSRSPASTPTAACGSPACSRARPPSASVSPVRRPDSPSTGRHRCGSRTPRPAWCPSAATAPPSRSPSPA